MGYIEDEIDRLRLRCIGCGKCSRVCPSLKHGGCDPMEMMIGGDEGIEHCIACGNCSKACRRTDPFTVMRDLLALRNGLHVSDSFKTTGYAMPIKPVEGCPEPEWTGDDVMVMPGCIVRCKVPYVEYSMSVALKAMDLKGMELPNNTCCMHPAQFREMTEMERRNVKKSMEGNASGKGIVTLCGGCSEELQDAGIDAQHIIPFLHANIDRLPRTSEPLKVALQPGCSAMPFKKQMAEIVEAMGYENINNQMGCCGKNTDVAGPLMAERMEECAKADVVVVGCPMCLVKYDALPEGKPVVHISELVAMASGDKKSLGYHTVPIP